MSYSCVFYVVALNFDDTFYLKFQFFPYCQLYYWINKGNSGEPVLKNIQQKLKHWCEKNTASSKIIQALGEYDRL